MPLVFQIFFLKKMIQSRWKLAHSNSKYVHIMSPALNFCNYKENKKINIRMLDTLFIEDFIDSMEEYFHF